MIMTSPSNNSVKRSMNPLRRYSDSPPSYDAVQAESHGFIRDELVRVEPLRGPPEPLVTGGPSSEHPLSPNVVNQDRETTPLYLDSTSGEPRVAYVAPDELTAQCTKYGHVQKAKYGTLSILAAAFFFPWGLLCLIGSRVVYCERCGLILRAPGCRDCGSRPTYYSGKRRAHC